MKDLGQKVVYQIYPRSFQDSDGDGVGDLKGMTARLDYLQSLGVDYVWSTPFFVSPQHDNGYDVADYLAVDPRFGTMEDAEEFIREAAKRGIGVMFDMVFNHTSTDHEWFQRALAGDPKYQKYYFFVDGEPDHAPTNWVSKFGGPAWEWVPRLHKWYLHLFDVSQADLNWENPEVREELKNVIRFWKAKGVSGFRFDVVNLISKPDPAEFQDDLEGDGRRFYTDGRHVHQFIRELAEDTELGDMITVGEMSSTSIQNCIQYSNPQNHQLSMTFSFHHLKVDYKDGDKWSLMKPDIDHLRQLFRDWEEQMTAGGGWNAWFWCNHDQPRAVSRFGNDADPQLWDASAKMLGTCVHFMRGTPYVYQGEELGMTNAHFDSIDQYRDVESQNYYRILQERGLSPEEALHVVSERSRDNGRTPMQWDGTPTAGFTTGTPWISIPANHEHINVEAQKDDPNSIMSYYKRLIALRHELPVIQDGGVKFVDVACGNDAARKVICYRRDLEDASGVEREQASDQAQASGQAQAANQPKHLLALCSFAEDAASCELPADLARESSEAVVLISNFAQPGQRPGLFTQGNGAEEPATSGDGVIELPPYGAMVLAW